MKMSLFEGTEQEAKVEGAKIVEQEKQVRNVSERAEYAGKAMLDAIDAYKIAGVEATSEDIRALAISFLIDEGKNGRTRAINKVTREIKSAAPQQDGRLPQLKFEENVPYTITINGISTIETKFGEASKYIVELGGVEHQLVTTAKVLVAGLKEGETKTVTMSKNGKYTNYDIK